MSSSLRDRILSGKGKLKRQQTTFMGETVWAWELTGKERAIVEQSRYKVDGKTGETTFDVTNFRALVVEYGTRESGEDKAPRVFTAEDGTLHINDLPGADLDALAELILGLSGMTADSKEALRKNSGATGSADNSSGSPTAAAGPASSGA